jgi:farnesyl-diphosphate farnesyltransferase
MQADLTRGLVMEEVSVAVDREHLDELLLGASRTFAINIPMLPGLLRDALTLGYLLLRNADTLEDAYQWPKAKRISSLDRLHQVVVEPSREAAERFAASFAAEAGIRDPAHLDLLKLTPYLLDQLYLLPSAYSTAVRAHVARVIRRMQRWVANHDDMNRLRIERLNDLDDYCYSVAGIVGELITALIAVYRPALQGTRLLVLRTLETACGAGLQLTNIIKDVFRDHLEGRYYIPSEFLPFEDGASVGKMKPILAYAYRHLCLGRDYALVLPEDELQIRQAVLLPIFLAVATLVELLDRLEVLFQGAEVKISRQQVMEIITLTGGVASSNEAVLAAWRDLSGPLRTLSTAELISSGP